jgi:hypothetical protein
MSNVVAAEDTCCDLQPDHAGLQPAEDPGDVCHRQTLDVIMKVIKVHVCHVGCAMYM